MSLVQTSFPPHPHPSCAPSPARRSWLEAGGPAVQRVLDHERRHAEAWLSRCAPLARQLERQMLRLTPPTLVSPPERVGAFEYYVQQLPGRPHPCYMRRPVGTAGMTSVERAPAIAVLEQQQQQQQQQQQLAASAQAQVVLDVNELAAVHGPYVQVGQASGGSQGASAGGASTPCRSHSMWCSLPNRHAPVARC